METKDNSQKYLSTNVEEYMKRIVQSMKRDSFDYILKITEEKNVNPFYVDILLNLYNYLSNCGFEKYNIISICIVYLDFLVDYPGKDRDIKASISHLYALSSSLIKDNGIPQSILDKWYTYILKSVLQHYNLYLYCLTTNRSVEERHKSVIIQTISDLTSLNESTKQGTLSYNLKIEEIENDERCNKEEILKQCQCKINELESENNQLQDFIRSNPYNDEQLKKIVTDILTIETKKNNIGLTSKIDLMVETLMHKFEKASLPVPRDLTQS